jgi:Domain of unknown function (DUF6966)
MSADFDVSYQKLLDSLDETVALLRRHAEQHWADWLAADRARIAEGDRYALDHLFSAFGGMGSLNDLVLQGPDPAHSFDDELRSANDRLWDLRDAIWRAGKEVQAELRRS